MIWERKYALADRERVGGDERRHERRERERVVVSRQGDGPRRR